MTHAERPGEEKVEEIDGIIISHNPFDISEDEFIAFGDEIKLKGENMGGEEEILELTRYQDGKITVGLGSLNVGAEFVLPNLEVLKRVIVLFEAGLPQQTDPSQS